MEIRSNQNPNPQIQSTVPQTMPPIQPATTSAPVSSPAREATPASPSLPSATGVEEHIEQGFRGARRSLQDPAAMSRFQDVGPVLQGIGMMPDSGLLSVSSVAPATAASTSTPASLNDMPFKDRFLSGDIGINKFARMTGLQTDSKPPIPSLKAQEIYAKIYHGGYSSWSQLNADLQAAGVKPGQCQHLLKDYAQRVTASLPQGTLLFLANEPTDAPDLDIESEIKSAQTQLGTGKTFVVHNPDLAEMQALVETGKFDKIWISGHGDQGVVCMTNPDGTLVNVPHKDVVKALAKGSEVQTVMTSICMGAFGGRQSLVERLDRKGIDAAGYESYVGDNYAVEMSQQSFQQLSSGATGQSALSQAAATTQTDQYGAPSSVLQARETAKDLAGAFWTDFTAGDKAQLRMSYHEYPGLRDVVQMCEIGAKGDAAGMQRFLAHHPDLQSIATKYRSLNPSTMTPANADAIDTLVYAAAKDYLEQQFLNGKPFTQVE